MLNRMVSIATTKSFASLMSTLASPPELLLRQALCRKSLGDQVLFVSMSSSSGYKAATCTELGKPLSIQTVQRQPLKSDQVRVVVRGAGLNFADILKAQGKYQEKSNVPFVPGHEIFGEVTEVGTSLSKDIRVGDKVYGFTNGEGGFAEEAVFASNSLMKTPQDLNTGVGSRLYSSYSTAYLALQRKANVRPGETVLVTAGAGALGLAAIDLAVNVFGAKVIAAAGSAEKCSFLTREKGVNHVLDYSKESIAGRVKELTGGRGVDVIVEAVGGKVFDECVKSLAFEGRLIVVGFASGDIPRIATNRLLLKSSSAIGVWFGNYQTSNPEVFWSALAEMSSLYLQSKIKPHVGKSFPLSKINEAFQYILERKSVGKVIITMDE